MATFSLASGLTRADEERLVNTAVDLYRQSVDLNTFKINPHAYKHSRGHPVSQWDRFKNEDNSQFTSKINLKKIQKRGIAYSGNNQVLSTQLLLIDWGKSVNDIINLSNEKIELMFKLHTVVASDTNIGYSDNSIRGEGQCNCPYVYSIYK